MLLVIELLLLLYEPHPFLVMTGGFDWGTVGIDFSFAVCTNIWESGSRKRSEKKLGKSRGEGDGCRPYVAGGRSGGTEPEFCSARVMMGVPEGKKAEEGCGYPELRP